MRVEGLRGRARRRFRATTVVDPHAQPATNHLARHFTVAAPNRVWAADITGIPTHDGWLYLAVLLDLWSRRVVGWALRPTLETELVCAALHLAVARRAWRRGLLHHSDRGAQYTSDRYQTLLRTHGIQCSMSRPGNCYDNAVVESFFRTLKTELGPQTHADAAGRGHGHHGLHRAFLQPRAAALNAALSKPRRLRGDLEGGGMMQSNPSTKTDQHHGPRTTGRTKHQGPRTKD